MGRKPSGYFRKITKAGKEYVIKVKSERNGDKVEQKFLLHVGSVEELRKLVCENGTSRKTDGKVECN